MALFIVLLSVLFLCSPALAQPQVPVEEWTGKTILLIGAHPDDDSRSHGTLSMLQEHGNEVYIVIKGRAKLRIDDRTVSVGPESILYVHATAEHSFFEIEEELTLLVFFGTGSKPDSARD